MNAGEHDYRVSGTEELYRGRILALRRDLVSMPGGRTVRREVIEHFGAVAVVAMDTEQRVAMVRQYRHPLGQRLLELPAGLLDVAGESAPEAAMRELAEEAGLAAESWSVLVDLAVSPGISDECVRVFLATGLTAVPRPELQGEEADEEAELTLHWLPLAEAVRRALAGELVNAHTVSGVLAAHTQIHSRNEPQSRGTGDGLRPADAPWPSRPTALPRRAR